MSTASATTTIRDREIELELMIEAVQRVDSLGNDQELRRVLTRVRDLFFPRGYKITVQLEEDGRKKRSTVDASYWNFDSGEVVIFYEPSAEGAVADQAIGPMPAAPLPIRPVAETPKPAMSEAAVDHPISVPTDIIALQQCVEALDEAEKLGKRFIAYKWFRDLVLPGLPYRWARDAEQRQHVLNAAVESGKISSQKIPNPHQPMFPTTTLSVNRTAAGLAIKSRFRPVPVIGEAVSTTLLRDRG